MQTPSVYSLVIHSLDEIAPHILFVTSLVKDKPLQFTAGQYGTVIIDVQTRRQYSFCSDPTDTTHCSFVIDTTPGGPGSQFFLQHHVGDEIQLLAPLGNFTIHPSPRKKVFVATGTGIAPLRSMILTHIKSTPMTLYWGLRSQQDVYWQDEFAALSRQYPTFDYHIVLSKPEQSWTGLVGHVTEHIQQVQSVGDNDYYLCGNQHMIADVKQTLLAKAVSEEQLFVEQF